VGSGEFWQDIYDYPWLYTFEGGGYAE